VPSAAEVGSGRLALSQAVLLGLLHGPTELAPVSSSGHLTVVPFLAGWDYLDLEPDLRKAFEVALHAGTAAALLIGLREEVTEAVLSFTPRLAGHLLCSFLPPAIIGYGLEGPIERRLGTPLSSALGLIGGGARVIRADRAPQQRTRTQAGAADALWLGVAQACALMPGVSRNGATLTAARLRRFRRVDANVLSRHVALPVIGGATGLKLARLARRGLPPGALVPFLAGAGASFASTLGSTWMLGQVERDRTLAPFGVYRIALGTAVLARLARAGRGAATAAAGSDPAQWGS
jgi:undecaprenyl-diphosphatase